MLTNMIQSLLDGIGNLMDATSGLPGSPFRNIEAVTVDNQILGMIAWFVPFNAIISLLQSWLVSVGIWYLAKKSMRWSKLIQ